jgi:DNA-binding CsgD family transcriptional regulator
VWCAAAELALARRDAESALRILDRVFASVPGIEARGPRAVPRLALLRGDALAALARRQEAEDDFLGALESAVAQENVRIAWRAHAALVGLYREDNRAREANHHAQVARSMVAEIAAGLPGDELREQFAEGAERILERARSRSHGPGRPTRQSPEGLTARETEVVRLLAQGKSNKQIAEMLVVAERTVEGHVSSILAKLGFTSRAQAAVWASENSRAPGP